MKTLNDWARPAFACGGVGIIFVSASGCGAVFADDDDVSADAVALQAENGWDMGSDGRPLVFAGSRPTDAAGSLWWRDALGSLPQRLSPSTPAWQPFYGPALFQSLQAPRNESLRAVMRPVLTPEMAVAERRGESLAALVVDDGHCRTDTAIVVDVPGPEAVAIAASLAGCFDPIFFFDNWPHPLGVVPSHLTLGAALYYLPRFEDARALRPPSAPPLFVLDRSRLAPYVDNAGQFDNRYLARLPEAGPLASAGIRHVLYVTPDERVTFESDDLNGDLVALDQQGIDVRMLAMSDFQPSPSGEATADNQPPPYYFGGNPIPPDWFWSWFGWGSGGAAPPPPTGVGQRCHFHPTYRPTFTSAFHGSPVGGGSIHVGGGFHGSPVGWGRSGSFGRMHSSFSG
jgi:hypothetical protein